MLVVRCLSKIRDNNNNIIGYILEDKAGNRKKVSASELKSNIQNKNVRCINLKLTSDNRLVDCVSDNNVTNKDKYIEAYKKYITKAKIIGSPFDFIVDEESGEILLTDVALKGKSAVIEIPSFVSDICAGALFMNIPEDMEYIKIIYRGNRLRSLRGTFENSRTYTIGKLDLSEFNMQGVKTMTCAFSKCLAYEIIANWESADSVTDITSMFKECYLLEKINLSKLDLSRVTKVNWAFNYCYNLKSIDFGNQRLSQQCEDAIGVFCRCSNLQEINTGIFKGTRLKRIKNIFMSCDSIKEINLSSIDSTDLICTDEMFKGDTNLAKITYGNFDTSNVTSMESMFSGCNMLEYIDTKNHIKIKEAEFANEMFEKCYKLKEVDMSSWHTDKLMYWRGMFLDCVSLERIDFTPCKTDNAVTFERMFRGCINLKTIIMIRCNVPRLKNIEEMFYGCESLEKINLNSFKTEKLNKYANAFTDCDSLKYLNTGLIQLEVGGTREMFTKRQDRKYPLQLVTKDRTILVLSNI